MAKAYKGVESIVRKAAKLRLAKVKVKRKNFSDLIFDIFSKISKMSKTLPVARVAMTQMNLARTAAGASRLQHTGPYKGRQPPVSWAYHDSVLAYFLLSLYMT